MNGRHAYRGLLLALAAAGLLLTRTLPARTAEGVVPGLNQAMAALQAGNYRQAVTLYDHLLSQYPGTTEARFQKGFALERLGDLKGAMAEYEATLRLNPKEVRAMNNLGFILVDRGLDVPRGERLLRRAIQLAPDFAAAYDSLGWAEYRRQNFAQAEDLLRSAMQKDPTNLSAYYHAGVMTLRRGDYARSALYLRKLVERDPRNVRGLMGLGMAYARLGQKEDARRTLAGALKLVNRDSAPGQEILRMLNELGPYFPGATLEHFLNAPSERTSTMLDYPSPAATARTAGSGDGLPPRETREVSRGPAVDFRKQPGDEASATSGSGTDARPALDTDLVRRHLQLARLYQQYELFADAEGELQTVINLDPDSPDARQARDLLPQVSQRPEVSKEARLAGYIKMGETLFTRRADAEAMLQYQKVLLADPTHPVANKALAFLSLRAGDVKKAQEYVDKALQREPRYLEALLVRGYLEARQRQFDRSSRSFDEAARLAAADSEVGRYAKEMAERMRRFSSLE